MSFIEFHLLQNFAPSNLNRDDTNTPKSCLFGGFQRARISSQCQKRQIRMHPDFTQSVLDHKGDIGVRTKKLGIEIRDALIASGHNEEQSEKVTENLLKQADLALNKKDKKAAFRTEYLLYVGQNEKAGLIQLAQEQFSELAEDKVDASLKKAVKALLSDKSFAADIALFGRMVADNANLNVNAACQVAHAISTNQVAPQMDFYTAVDDALTEGEQGSGMMGAVYFNSACYYRYAQINLSILLDNLGKDKEQALGTIQGFFKGLIQAVPSGKQNSFAAQNPPSYIKVNVRNNGAPWALTNAFTSPVMPTKPDEGELEQLSAQKLETMDAKLKRMYGEEGFVFEKISTYLDDLSYADKQCTIAELEKGLLNCLNEILESA